MSLFDPEYIVRVNAPKEGTIKPRHKGFTYYHVWDTTDEVDQWLGEHVKHDVFVRHVKSYPEGDRHEKFTRYVGLDFVFSDPDDAILFKLTWV